MARQDNLRFAFCVLQFAVLLPALALADEPLAAQEEAALRAAADSIAPSVVQIRTIGGLDSVEGTLLTDGPTTGLVFSADGYIISSAFNFVQQPASILVTFASGKQTPAELIATDHSRMLVLLKAAGVSDLPVAPLAPDNEIRVGQWAVAIGRTFRADHTNISVGIVSAVNRMLGKAIQTDADISTANYGGPLVDIRGRVLGLLVPMAPQGTSEVAGTEWYDSGIGFAVPLAALGERIELMKKGEDQRAGLLGIAMTPKDPHSSPALLAAVRPDSPAGQAGLKKGDRIIELDGKPIRTQTDLRFALSPRYAGDSVRVVANRGDERIERTFKLIGEMPAFRHAFLGILPMRPTVNASSNENGNANDDAEKENISDATATDDASEPKADDADKSESKTGIVVRAVFDGSPAAEAGIEPGDRVVRINDADIDTIASAIQELNNAAPGVKIRLQLIRGDAPLDLELTASRLPTSVPEDLPPAYESPDEVAKADTPEANAEPPAATVGETVDLKLPEFAHTCKVYVPRSHDPPRPLPVLLWLQPPKESSADDLIRQWQSICDRDGILLVVPAPAEANRWERTDVEYLRRLTERVIAQYQVDPLRVVVHGQSEGGASAWLIALSSRDLFRGVSTSASPLPRQIRVPQNDPAQRLAIFAAVPSSKDSTAQITQGLQKLSDAGYNVATITTSDSAGELGSADRNELARWIDTLDRF